MPTVLRPLASVGAFVFDCELSSTAEEVREYTTRRVPTGADLIDHSVLNPGGRRWSLTGRVSEIGQPQNLGRPSATPVAASLENLVQNLAAGLIGLGTRLADAENVLSATIAEGQEVTVVSKKLGRFQAVVTRWSKADGPSDGGGSTYSVEVLEILRAASLSFIDPNEVAEALNGSGSTTSLGPTSASSATLDLVA